VLKPIKRTKQKFKFKLCLNPLQKREFILKLTPGELLEGEVVKQLSNQKILISFKGSYILTESRLELKTGDRILLKVEKLYPKVVLSLIFRKSSLSETIDVRI
jgi:hypothetical protein